MQYTKYFVIYINVLQYGKMEYYQLLTVFLIESSLVISSLCYLYSCLDYIDGPYMQPMMHAFTGVSPPPI